MIEFITTTDLIALVTLSVMEIVLGIDNIVFITMMGVLVQIAILDLVFSLDSVITAVGLSDKLWVMVVAIVLAVIVMMFFAKPVGNFVTRHPTVKMLALSFLLLIGVMLVVEGFGKHIEHGYIYFAMGFSLLVEMLNMKVRKNRVTAAH